MLTILHNKEEIRAAQETLENILNQLADEIIGVNLGIKYRKEPAQASYNHLHDFWFYFGGPIASNKDPEGEPNHYWNVFGLGRPKGNASIVVEINIPLEGINGSFGGVFAKDRKTNLYLLHRGNIGGGRRGIGKTLFYDMYEGRWQFVIGGWEQGEYLPYIGRLSAKNFPGNLSNFIREVDRIKSF